MIKKTKFIASNDGVKSQQRLAFKKAHKRFPLENQMV